jgi:enoyl-CoA hydratase/carnithine racemase
VTKPIEHGVHLDVDGPIARITLDRPEQHNALRLEDVTRLRAFLDEVEGHESVRAVLVTGSGARTFCAGASLQQMESGEMSGQIFDTLTDRLAHLALPTVCVLNGSIYGGGAELALCCDFRVGSPDVRLAVPAARLGVCYPVGGLGRYVRRLGLPVASRILLAAEELDAAELHRVGYLTHLVDRDEWNDTGEGLAARLSSLAPLAVQSMKRIMLDVAEGVVDEALASELIDRCTTSEDLAEGLTAHREGRAPVFTGR